MDNSFIYYILFLNFGVSIIFFVKKNNEIPFFLAVFNLLVQYRVTSLENGYSQFVYYNYGIDFIFNMKYAYIASKLILLGSTIMMYAYILLFKAEKKMISDSNELLKAFIILKRTQILIGLGLFSLLSYALRGGGNGYSNLIAFGNNSFIIMVFLVVYFGDKQKFMIKVLYGLLFCFLSYLSYSTGGRFQFLGWIITIIYFLARNIRPGRKIVFSFFGMFVIMVFFSLAGVLRNQSADDLTVGQLYGASVQRLLIADDVNFIDGFMMTYQVYPKILDYEYGMQHIEILLRPIPRSLWPSKPQASWVRKYQEKYTGTVLESAGFSPTIWGVFYAEGGIIAIVIFSIFWAWLLVTLYRRFTVFKSDLSKVLIGILLASMIPVFRSGDMAGDFAIVLMSFWPLYIFVRQYKAFLKKLKITLKYPLPLGH